MFIYLCMCIRMYICKYMNLYMHNIHMYIHICVCTYVCINAHSGCARGTCCQAAGWCSRLGRAGMLQCVAMCCSALQCVAVCCSVLQCVAVSCNVLL